MAYKSSLRKKIALAPNSVGKTLGSHAVRTDFSVLRISKATGATRQTIYNWFVGGVVAPYYRDRVAEIIDILKDSQTAEYAWRTVCSRFHLRT
jgi:hypothetical protein|tara:strand:- start:14 stop:292 length:279 start_codon:yes stop_codon:yes gene_type:complete